MKPIHLLATASFLFLAAPCFASQPQSLTSPDQVPEGLEKSDWQSIRAAHDAWQHEFREIDGTWQAQNPGQRWTTVFDGRGFLATPKEASWTWGLELKSYGFETSQQAVTGTPEIKASGQRLSYHWKGGLEEWFINDQRGLEHGFIVPKRPEGAAAGEPLVFTLSTLGTLRPSVAKDALTVHFRDALGAPVLNYSGLKVWDADGKILTSRFEATGKNKFRLLVDEAGARYPITIDPIAQQAYLKAGNNGAATDDGFGRSVAVSGDTVVVGAPGEGSSTTGVNSTPNESASGSGAAYVFTRSGTTWSQQAYLKASNPGQFDFFGTSVAVSGDTVIVGAPVEDSSTTGVNSTPNESASGSGAAYVFTRSGTTWSQQAYLKASNTGTNDLFGSSVAVSGDTVVVGAPYEDSSTKGVNNTPNESASSSGAAYVFTRSGTTWSQQAYLKASNTGAGDEFGLSVAVSGGTVVVRADGEDSSTTGVNSTPNESASGSGAAYVFTRSGTRWSQQAYLKASNTGAFDYFGSSVAVSGDTVVVGAPYEDSSTKGVNSTPNDSALDSGAAYVFTRIGTTWSQQAYLKASNTSQGPGWGDGFGISVAVSDDTVVVGAPYEDSSTTGVNSSQTNNTFNSGAAYVFTRNGMTWSQQAYLKASNTGESDWFGDSVAVSGDTVVVGAPYEDSSTTGVNSTPNERASDSGAAYIFTGFDTGSQTPVIGLATSSGITGSGAILGGTVVGEGDAPITERGVVHSVTSSNPNPLIGGAGVVKTTTSGTTGVFTVAVNGLSPGTKYSSKAYATNANGTSYTPVASFTTLPVGTDQAFAAAIAAAGLTGNDALPNSTPFHDGVENLLKYAFNMNLAAPDVTNMTSGGNAGLPAIRQVGTGAAGILRFEFVRRIGSGLVYTPKKSTTLDATGWTDLTDTPTIIPINANWERVIYEEPSDPDLVLKCFGRVEVVNP